MINDDSENIANKYIGKPWVSGGRGPHVFDCFGLVKYVLREDFGIEIDEEYLIHGKDIIGRTKAFELASKSGKWVHEKVPFDGCAVALSQGTKIHHAGIWVEGGCLHAVDGACVIHSDLLSLKINQYNRIEFYSWQK